jgi:putative ABC transport system ATP-binding protein
VIRLVDGQIVDDLRQAPVDGLPPALRDPEAFADAHAHARRFGTQQYAQQYAQPAAPQTALLDSTPGGERR